MKTIEHVIAAGVAIGLVTVFDVSGIDLNMPACSWVPPSASGDPPA